MMVWKMMFLFQGCILKFHVKLQGCRLFYKQIISWGNHSDWGKNHQTQISSSCWFQAIRKKVNTLSSQTWCFLTSPPKTPFPFHNHGRGQQLCAVVSWERTISQFHHYVRKDRLPVSTCCAPHCFRSSTGNFRAYPSISGHVSCSLVF